VLFFLTGNIQIGKTRWLQGVIDEVANAGVTTYGVIAPGRWVERSGAFEKMGIDNVMLPQGERVNLADPAERGWNFHEAAIQRVDHHFAELADLAASLERREVSGAAESLGSSGMAVKPEKVEGIEGIVGAPGGLLVVDELGWMELEKGCGLTSAVRLLDNGAAHLFPNAVVVVRETLLPLATQRFAGANWGGTRPICPDEASRAELLEQVLPAIF